MDQATARKLFEEGSFFILLNVPEGTEFGIDMKSWNTGERFRGVKMIPPGIHYIFYSAVSSYGDVTPRTGFFHNFRKNEVLVKKWDQKNECISEEEVEEAEVVKLKQSLRMLNQFLGPYPYDILEKWQSLSSHIRDDLMKKLIPLSGYVRSALELQPCTDADRPKGGQPSPSSSKEPKKSRLSGNIEDDFLPNLKAKQGTELRFTVFPEKNYPEGSTPSEITKHSLDMSYVLDNVLTNYSMETDIIGELQLCYICFLVGHSLEAFDQWKKLFGLFCSCETALKKHRRLFNLFISVIEPQIKEVPEEFLADIVANKNFVYVNLKRLFRVLKNSDVDGILRTKAERLMGNLSDSYLWDFEDLDSDEEDEAPVIVETN